MSKPSSFVTVLLALAAAACGAVAQPPPAPPKGAAAVPVVANKGKRLEAGEVDLALRAAWRAAGVTPAPPASDARWMRRVYLDVIGTVPTDDEARAFLADRAPDRRRVLVERLLGSPRYAEHWGVYWDRELMGQKRMGNQVDAAAFRGWLRDRFAANEPWDKIVFALISATGQNSSGGPRPRRAVAYAAAPDPSEPVDVGVNPAVNWHLRYADAPQDLAGNASRTFLGVQIQCAQCHDHKTEAWKQGDFRSFAACFARTQIVRLDARTAGEIQRVELRDAARPVPRFAKNPELTPIAESRPRALDGTDLAGAANARFALAAWMVNAKNPWFAKAMTNRMWAHFLGRGFVDPVDDLRPSNAPAVPALFERVARDFADGGHDPKSLIRLITATEAYGLAPAAPPGGDGEDRLWSRFRLVPLGPEELVNALFTVTDVGEVPRARVEQLRANLFRQYGFLFDLDEETDHKDFEGSVAQALALINGQAIEAAASLRRGSALARVLLAAPDDAARVDAVYLRVLARVPSAEERREWMAFLAAASGPKQEACVDVFWALLNSSEFLFNH